MGGEDAAEAGGEVGVLGAEEFLDEFWGGTGVALERVGGNFGEVGFVGGEKLEELVVGGGCVKHGELAGRERADAGVFAGEVADP